MGEFAVVGKKQIATPYSGSLYKMTRVIYGFRRKNILIDEDTLKKIPMLDSTCLNTTEEVVLEIVDSDYIGASDTKWLYHRKELIKKLSGIYGQEPYYRAFYDERFEQFYLFNLKISQLQKDKIPDVYNRLEIKKAIKKMPFYKRKKFNTMFGFNQQDTTHKFIDHKSTWDIEFINNNEDAKLTRSKLKKY